jgi:hypothetical protein
MSTDMFNCDFSTWLAMAFMSVGGLFVLLILFLALAALGKYLLTGSRTNRPSAP